MRIIVAVLTSLLLLVAGVVWLFGLLVALNGVSEAKATPILVGYLVLLVFTVILAGIAGGWGARAFTGVTNWSIWLTGPLTILVVNVVGIIVIGLGSILLIVILGVK